MTGLRTILAAAALAFPLVAGAQESAPRVDGPRVQVAVPDAPVIMRSDDAARLRSSVAPPAPVAPPAAPVSSGVTRTITLATPPVVNRSSQFQFRDLTDRPPRAVLPLAARKAAVEEYRRSIAATKGRGR